MGARAKRQIMVKKVSKGSAPKETFPKNAVEKKGRTFSIGGDVMNHKRDLTRFVRWPKYVRLQRAKMTLLKRIKIPPAINQFQNTFDQKQASTLFRLLNSIKPETRATKKERLAANAEKAAGGDTSGGDKRPVAVKMGINHVTSLIEEKKAKLVVIAHDVDPIETIVWLPSLCKARGVPYCIVKSKARLGAVVGKKTATCLAITDVNAADKNDLQSLVTVAKTNFNDVHEDALRKWGDAVASGRQMAAEAKRKNFVH